MPIQTEVGETFAANRRRCTYVTTFLAPLNFITSLSDFIASFGSVVRFGSQEYFNIDLIRIMTGTKL